ncbi:MAG: hypothetical protein V1819_03840 [bacterium]
MKKPLAKLGVGPMSLEIIEAVFRYSDTKESPLMLIPSLSQINFSGGYVNNWTTTQFAEFIALMRKKYQKAVVYMCRDHCGPGFNGDNLLDVQKNIDDDIDNGFNLIHIDFSKLKGSYDDILQESKKAIINIKAKNPQVMIEVGTDENTGAFLEDIERIEKEMQFFTSICPIEFFVCQTGSLVKEVNQRGGFNASFLEKVKEKADKFNLALKEHNADYLDSSLIGQRKGIISALNVAPQCGVLQTQLTIEKCLFYGIDFTDFLQEAYNSRKWEKWMDKSQPSNAFLCSIIAGHYVFAGESYKKLFYKISQRENFQETVINYFIDYINYYVENFS